MASNKEVTKPAVLPTEGAPPAPSVRRKARKSRWTTDPGAIPGEPADYLDIPIGEEGEIAEAKAVIVEIETPGGSRWEARAFGGRFLGMFETAEQARSAAEAYVDEIEPKRR